MKTLIGRKAGMTQMFADDGRAFPVTIIEILPNVVMQVKTKEKDGYDAIQLGVADKKESRATKAEIGHAKKANTAPKYFLHEIRDAAGDYAQGSTIPLSIFANGEYVDVQGTSKGKGFAGGIKRWNFSRGPETHGSKYHRAPGSSTGTKRSKVFKDKKSPGRLGGDVTTVKNLFIVKIDEANNAIAVRGSIPGPNSSFVLIKQADNQRIKPEVFNLVNVAEEKVKNELLIEAKHVGATVTSAMSISEMKSIIAEATIKHEAELKEKAELIEKAEHLAITNPGKMSIEDLKKAIMLAEQHEKERAAKAAEDAKVKEEAATKQEESQEEGNK